MDPRSSEPYDPYIPSGSASGGGAGPSSGAAGNNPQNKKVGTLCLQRARALPRAGLLSSTIADTNAADCRHPGPDRLDG